MIRCEFECKKCGLGTTPFAVRYREPGEDIVKWVKGPVTEAMAESHRRNSPHCKAQTADLMIPIPVGEEGIGERPLNAPPANGN